MNKISSVVFCFLLVSSTLIFPIQSDASQQDEIIYVDDDNTDGPWDGSIDHPFQYIQDGIDTAREGDTVFVFNGTYTENVMIDTSIILQGENKNITVLTPLDADWKTIDITANGVCVKNFQISGGEIGIYIEHSTSVGIFNNYIKNNYNNGICAWEFTNDSIIENNIIQNNGCGLHIHDSSKNIVSDNIFKDNSRAISSVGSSYTNIFDNQIINNHEGIDLHGWGTDSLSCSNRIINNTIFHSSVGIKLLYFKNNTVSTNQIFDCDYGIEITEDTSSENNFINNVFQNSGFILWSMGPNNSFKGNTVNGKPVLYLEDNSMKDFCKPRWGQVLLVNCKNITCAYQNISNTTAGVQLLSCTNCNISYHTISSTKYGITLRSCTNCDITHNKLTKSNTGVHIGLNSKNITLGNNIVQDNTYGMNLCSKQGKIMLNTFLANTYGIYLDYFSNDNEIAWNQYSDNNVGIYSDGSSTNMIILNEFSNNTLGINLSYHIFKDSSGSQKNTISKNNFFHNEKHAFFLSEPFDRNKWKQNYWENPHYLPYLITGILFRDFIFLMPVLSTYWINIDWHPAQEPYDLIDGGYE